MMTFRDDFGNTGTILPANNHAFVFSMSVSGGDDNQSIAQAIAATIQTIKNGGTPREENYGLSEFNYMPETKYCTLASPSSNLKIAFQLQDGKGFTDDELNRLVASVSTHPLVKGSKPKPLDLDS